MALIRTYVDSGVLILAARLSLSSVSNSFAILTDPNREFAASPFVQLKVVPKETYYRKTYELDFYNRFFANVQHWADDLDSIVKEASIIAATYGLAAMDALHVAAALSIKADELVTTELATKPMFRVGGLKITSTHP